MCILGKQLPGDKKLSPAPKGVLAAWMTMIMSLLSPRAKVKRLPILALPRVASSDLVDCKCPSLSARVPAMAVMERDIRDRV